MKTQTVVAAYQDAQDAHTVVQALAQAGIPREHIHAFPERDFFEEENRIEAERLRAHQQRPAIQFFRDLFGMDETHRHDHDAYAEAVRRGHYIVAVQAGSLEMVDQVTAILNNAGHVDIDSRAAHWRSQGWSGYDENAPAMTADEIRRDRALYPSNSDLHDGPGSYAGKLLDNVPAPQAGSTGSTVSGTSPALNSGTTTGIGNHSMERRGNLRVYSAAAQRDSFDAARGADGMPQPAAGIDPNLDPTLATRATPGTAGAASIAGAAGMTGTTGSSISSPMSGTSAGSGMAGGTTSMPAAHDMTGARMNADADDDMEFRRHWQSSYGSGGGRYEDYDSAYRHGASIGRDSRFSTYRWDEVEPHARSDWEARNPGSTWDKVKDAVRYAAERATGRRHH